MDITLLDGSIGQELMKRSDDAPTALWSTLVMIEHPELVGHVHAEYFRVGATIATTNTYPVLQDRLDTNGYDLDIRLLWDVEVHFLEVMGSKMTSHVFESVLSMFCKISRCY